jgi:hypothetical protein
MIRIFEEREMSVISFKAHGRKISFKGKAHKASNRTAAQIASHMRAKGMHPKMIYCAINRKYGAAEARKHAHVAHVSCKIKSGKKKSHSKKSHSKKSHKKRSHRKSKK